MKRVTDIYKEDTFYKIVQTLSKNEVNLCKCNQNWHAVWQYTIHLTVYLGLYHSIQHNYCSCTERDVEK